MGLDRIIKMFREKVLFYQIAYTMATMKNMPNLTLQEIS